MSDVFNFKRFGKFFSYDLNNAKSSFGLSLLIMSMMPVILFFFNELFSFIFSGSFAQLDINAKTFCFICCFWVLALVAPSKMYGQLTDKRKGSDWILIPASSLEKSLSMIIMLCLVAPFVFFAVYFGADFLMASFFPGTYGNTITEDRSGVIFNLIKTDSMEIQLGKSMLSRYAGLCLLILSFALGALCFKKNKVGKTILCWFALTIVLSMIIVFIFGHNLSFTSDDYNRLFFSLTPEQIRLILWSCTGLAIIGLMTAIYFRIKTIKH
ncbi:MAG: hypothetical protein Q4G10_01300 [Bacteroidia bacterium]|nr:hypothetical protein [Bacteroidia bacterium]